MARYPDHVRRESIQDAGYSARIRAVRTDCPSIASAGPDDPIANYEHARLRTPDDLRREIENLSDAAPVHSDRAHSDIGGIPHVTIVNGFVKPECARRAPPTPDMISIALHNARELRACIDGPARLSWRLTPTWDGNGDLRMRLCFEAP